MIVIVNKPRPDARVFTDLLFPPGRNIDSDGDADIVYTRDWHYLYLKDRESDMPAMTLNADKTKPLRFEVKSQSVSQQELVAIYLYLYCGKSIEDAGKTLSSNDITRLKKRYSTQLIRVEISVWHKSNATNPFPNQKKT